MNNTFDWKRFQLVVRKDFHNLWPMFGTTALILAVLPFFAWLLVLVTKSSATIEPDYRVLMIMMVSAIAAIMLPSRLYRSMNLRNDGIYYAMLPASKLEKFLSMLLFTFIVAPVGVYLGSMLVDIILYLLPAGPYRQWLWQGHWGFPLFNTVKESDMLAPGFHSGWVTAAMWTSYLANPAIFLFAATLFKKHKVLYTFLFIYLFEFVCTIILIPIFVSLAKNPSFMEWVSEFFVRWTPDCIFNWFFGLLTASYTIVAIVFTWLAWHRLKKMPY